MSAVRNMLNDLAQFQFACQHGSFLENVCKAGSEYGLRALIKTAPPELVSMLRSKAKRHIEDDLRHILARATRPCLTLKLKAFRCAYEAIYFRKGTSNRELIERQFLAGRPYDRLMSLFKEFPILPELWCQLIYEWRVSISELLVSVERDKKKLSGFFFRGRSVGKIIDLRAGLSDPHNMGRTVMRVRFQTGSVIYKPRCGRGEKEWFDLTCCLNAASVGPKLRAARVLCRDGYCWMEEIKFRPCKDQAAARRFYKRLGAMIAAAYLFRAVDCHRDNVIAAGEYPVLVDAETLWHITGQEKTKDFLGLLFGTGFLPTSDRRSTYQYRSSVLGKTSTGKHTPRIATKCLRASQYESEIVSGFRKAWLCLLGTRGRRAVFRRRLQRVRRRVWRRIYRSTEDYYTIVRASIQPAALRFRADRNMLIARLCGRSGVSQHVIREEINALSRLDIPYFIRRAITRSRPAENDVPTSELIEALRSAIHL
jgi:lantibiotic modifying enzyme